MPLFMDRHDVPGATAEDVAQAHLSDLRVAADFGVQFFSYWFDPDKGGVFCFARAPERESLVSVHEKSHGLIPNEIIAVSEDDVLRFLGHVHDPVDHTEVTSPFRTIMFTDLEGSTALLESLGEAPFLELLKEHDLIIRRALVAATGREVKHTGDGILAAFDSVERALTCALAIRRGFDQRNQGSARPELRVRLGMAAGEPVDHNDDIYGSAVNLASRLCAAAEPQHILVSEVVRNLAPDGFRFGDPETRHVKGFAEPVVVYEVIQGSN